jgi:hypothetical protein
MTRKPWRGERKERGEEKKEKMQCYETIIIIKKKIKINYEGQFLINSMLNDKIEKKYEIKKEKKP